MKLKGYLFFSFILAIAVKAEDEKKEFVEVTTLNNLKSYLSNGINETEKCYNAIKNEYEKEIDDFHQKIKNVLTEISKLTWGPVDYSNYARNAFAELQGISEKLIRFKTLLSNSFIKSSTKDGYELAVFVKQLVDGHYTKYLQFKNMFKANPHRGYNTFMKFDQKYRVEVYKKFKPISDRFKSCNDKNRKVSVD